jgi:DNA-binding response OmpR family regulator
MSEKSDKPKSTEGVIQSAMERGEFNNLKGKGKPLDLNEYFDTPEEIRISYTLLKNAGYVPEEVQLRNQIEELKSKIKQEMDQNRIQELRKQLRDAQLNYDLRMERLRKR